MPIPPTPFGLFRIAIIALSAAALSACVGSYTGPVEVTRFVSQQPTALGQGTITIEFPEEMENQIARNAVAAAVADQLAALGYTVVLDGSAPANHIATVRTSRNALAAASSRGPVSVGVGGQTGTFGTGGGVGIGINLGGGQNGPNVSTDLSVRISDRSGASLWEGRASQATSVKSPYSPVEAAAQTLAAALFKDFPGGNGETVTIDVDDLQEQ